MGCTTLASNGVPKRAEKPPKRAEKPPKKAGEPPKRAGEPPIAVPATATDKL